MRDVERRGATRDVSGLLRAMSPGFSVTTRCMTVDVDFSTITRRRLYALFRSFIKNFIPPTTRVKKTRGAVVRGVRRKLDGSQGNSMGRGATSKLARRILETLTFRAHC